MCSDVNDFNNAVITATFEADAGGNLQTDLNVPIPVFDDEIDEAHAQVFIVQLVVDNAVNRGLITIERAASNCIIIDNDREYDNVESTTPLIMSLNTLFHSSSNRFSTANV